MKNYSKKNEEYKKIQVEQVRKKQNDTIIQNSPVRILQLTSKLCPGGVQNFLLNYAEHMDTNNVVFDYVVQTKEPCVWDERAKQMKSKIYNVTSIDKSVIGYMKDVYRLLKTHPEYKIVHAHLNYRNIMPLIAARLAGLKVRISHSHSNYSASTVIKSIERKIFRLLLPVIATDNWACSELSGEWMYRKSNKIKIIHNAISQSKYQYSQEIRDKIRKELQIEDKTVWIHIGMFGEAKNHKFLLMLFAEHLKKDSDTVLLLCGDGAGRKGIEEQAEEYGITEKLVLLGLVDNVNVYLMAADLMLLPSLYEGLPIVCVEAQAIGCPVVASCAVPDEVIFNNNVVRCPTWNIESWEEQIKYVTEVKANRDKASSLCREKGYDIIIEAKKLEKEYIRLYERVIN